MNQGDDVTAAWSSAPSEPFLTLTRAYSRPAAEVWDALTTPARLAAWMGVEWLGPDGPLSLGAPFDYRFANTDMESRGKVLRFEPPRLLEHSWFENIPPAAIITWAVEPEGEGCRLTLTHRAGPIEDGPRTAAGWTMLLGSLAASLGEGDPPAGMTGWKQARDRYAAAFPRRASRDGRQTQVEGAPALIFERWLDHAPQAVWSALTEPEAIGRWMQAGAEVDPRPGGAYRLTFGHGDSHMDGEILVFDPPRRLEFTWPETSAHGDSRVAFEIAPDGDGSRLTLTHVFYRGGDMPDFASAWHWHLDCLTRALTGEAVAFDRSRWQALRGAYAATL